MRLCGVDWIDLLNRQPNLYGTVPSLASRLTQAQDANPQNPPAIATDKGEVGESLP